MGICSVGMDWSNPRLDRPTHLARRYRHWGGVVEDEEWYEVPQVAASHRRYRTFIRTAVCGVAAVWR